MSIEHSSLNIKKARLSVSLYYFAQGIIFSSWASRIPDIKTNLHLDAGQLGTVLLCLPVGQLLTMPFSGRLVTRFGARKILMVMAAAYAFELTNIGLVTHMWQLMVALFVFGICGNMSNIAVNTQGVLAEKLYDRPIMASFHGAWSAAGFTGSLLGLLMARLHIDPYPHFWIAASLSFANNLLFNRYLVPGKGEAGGAKQAMFTKPSAVLVQLGIIAFCSMAAEGAMFDWSGVYFKEVVHAWAGLGLACFMITMATGRFIGDHLIHRFGRKQMMQFCGVLITFGLTLSVLVPFLYAAIPGFMMVGFGVSIMVPSVYSAAGRVGGTSPGRALAVASGIGYFGFLMGPPLIGYIAQLSSLKYSYAVIAVFGIAITFMVRMLHVIR